MLALAGDTPGVFHVDLELRYLPVTNAVKSLVSAGAIGPPLLVRVVLESDWGRQWAEGERVAGLSTWYIDVIDTLIEEPATSVFVGGAGPGPDSPIEVGTASFKFPSGAVGEWAFNLRSGADLDLRLRIIGADGEIEADLLRGAYRHRRPGESWTTGEAGCSHPVHGFVGMRESIMAFFAAVMGEKDSRSGPEVYERVHSMQAAVWRSATAGTAVQTDTEGV
jgi:predicted dehydrogenase